MDIGLDLSGVTKDVDIRKKPLTERLKVRKEKKNSFYMNLRVCRENFDKRRRDLETKGLMTIFTRQNIGRIMHDQRQVNGRTTTLSKEIEELHREGSENIDQVFYKYKAVSKSSLHFLNKSKDDLMSDRQVMRIYRCKKAEKDKTFRVERKPPLDTVNSKTPPLTSVVTPVRQQSAIKTLDQMAVDPNLSSQEIDRIKIVRQLAASKKLRQRQMKKEREMLSQERAEFFE